MLEASPKRRVGAATRDAGYSLTKFTFRVAHATDPDANAEGDFILGKLIPNSV